jgi:hypothetical protein
MGMRARKRERVRDQREDGGYRWLNEFDGFAWQLLRTPADDFVHLTVFPNGEKNERGEEE